VRGWKLCKDVASGKKTWNVLFEGSSFFTQHATYLQVDIVSTNEDDFRVWFGLCEARMRLLIVGLESPENGVRAYPFAKFFHRRSHDDTFRYVASFFIALRFADSVQRVDLGSLATDFLQVVNSWEKRLSTMDLIMNVVPQKKLPSFVFEDEEEVDATVETTISEQPYVESRDTDVDDIKVTTRTPASLKKKQPDSTSPSEFISPLKRTRIT
jgi:poly(A) polymerase Pap1